MARRPGIVVEGGWYHVCNRVASGESIFADPNEAIEFVEIVRDVKKRDGWTVIAWCLMSNHHQVVIRTSSVPLWRGMHGIQNRFSRELRSETRHPRRTPVGSIDEDEKEMTMQLSKVLKPGTHAHRRGVCPRPA